MNKNQAFPWDHPRFRSWIGVARACQLMQQAMTRAIADLDIKTPHLDILINLYRFDGISQQELARKLLVGRSNMSMLLPQLEKRGLIERRPDVKDKRILRLSLTEAGREIRRQRDIVDQAAASIILNTALETERRTGRAPGQGVGIRDGDT